MFDRAEGERDSSALVSALRRRWWVIVLVALVAAVGGYVFANRQEKKYSTDSALLFLNSDVGQELLGKQVFNTVDPSRQAATNQSLVALPAVSELVAHQLGISAGRVLSELAFNSDPSSDVLHIKVTDPSPQMAANIANAYVQEYIAFRQQAARAQLSASEALVTSKLAQIPASQANGPVAQTLLQDRNNLELLASAQTGNAQQVQTATVPSSPSFPTPSRDAIIGLLVGLLAAGVIVAVLERLDWRIKSAAEVDDLYGVPVLGLIPVSSALDGPGARGTARDQDAFGMVRAQLRYFDVDRDTRRVMVTSAESAEGKSLISLNIARAAARSDEKSVLLIEADMRRPSLTEMIGLEQVAGLAELLSHSQDLASGLRELVVAPEQDTGDPAKLDVLLAGTTPPNPVELLESKRMADLLDHAESIYDLVIIDTPPIGVVSDAIPLVHQVDGVLVISRLGRTRRDHAVRLMKQLRGLNAHILGVVVNGAEPTVSGYYGGYTPGGSPGRRSARRARDSGTRQTISKRG
jgi:capsular exopolysaccharide synthesis family protein